MSLSSTAFIVSAPVSILDNVSPENIPEAPATPATPPSTLPSSIACIPWSPETTLFAISAFAAKEAVSADTVPMLPNVSLKPDISPRPPIVSAAVAASAASDKPVAYLPAPANVAEVNTSDKSPP